MAVYTIDFSGEVTGSPPSGWTVRWTSTGQTWAVREKAGTNGGKCLEHTRTTTARRLISWDTVDADATRDNVELLVRCRTTNPLLSDQLWLVARASGAAGSETAYILRNTSATQIQIARMLSGGLISSIGSANLNETIIADDWQWVRFRVNGTSLKAKIWNQHQNEPSAWNIEVTDSNISGVGWVGVGNAASSSTRDYDDIAVATNGDTAVFAGTSPERITQSVILALTEGDSDARVTQSTMLVLYEEQVTIPTRITQSVMLALAEYDADIRITQDVNLVLCDYVPCMTQWAQCWTITRTDGQVFGFTTLDRAINFRGVSHIPCRSLMASAAEMSTVLGSTGNMSAVGVLSDVGISEADVHNGLFNFATIEIWSVPYNSTSGDVPFRIMAGTLGDVRFGFNQYEFEIMTDAAKLRQQAVLETFTPGCRYQFGNQRDSRCPVDLTTITVTGTVTGVAVADSSTQATRRVFIDSSRAEVAGHFDLGVLTWLTGANAGVECEVKSFDAGGTFVLWTPTIEAIAIGDQYEVYSGCDKTKTGHLRYNADVTEFGGFPDVPGQDSINQTPDQKG